jgi:hypothetical protein
VLDQAESGVVQEVLDIGAAAGQEIVDAEHLVLLAEQPLAEVRTKESCAPGHEYPFG